MWFTIFKFEIQYRVKRLETYLYFAAVFLFSIIAFDFIFSGNDIGQIKENAPYIIAKVMAIVSGIFMLITSMVMGTPVLRDFDHRMESLMFVNPIKKSEYLAGRFLGSLTVLIFIFSGVIWGMITGTFMPWREPENLLAFNFWHYLKPFITLVVPTLFYAGSIFFVSGTLSRKLIVVYTQGLLFFMLSILSFSIENETVGSLLEPLGYTSLDYLVKTWEATTINNLSIPVEGMLLYNRITWTLIGVLVWIKGYYSFKFSVLTEKKKTKKSPIYQPLKHTTTATPATFVFKDSFSTSIAQLKSQSLFHFRTILSEPSFWAIIICGAATIFINAISLGTSYGVNSYPTTYLIVEELQEMSIWFFLIILIFYTGELIWKERDMKLSEITDSLPVTDFINLSGKFIGLNLVYLFLLTTLMLAGIAFQTTRGYFEYDFYSYFIGLFLIIFPFLSMFTIAAFFFQIISNAKYLGHLLTMLFFISIMVLGIFKLGHGLYQFGGIGLEDYSEMNGYGYFIKPYLWFKTYWFAFCILLFVLTIIFNVRGQETRLLIRWKSGIRRLTKPVLILAFGAAALFLTSGFYIFYNTNVLNQFYSNTEKVIFRATYEKTLKSYEYLNQPKIVAVNLKTDLFPKQRSYTVAGYYLLENKSNRVINDIHIQKHISDDVALSDVTFGVEALSDRKNERFGYYIYHLSRPLAVGDSIKMSFKQVSESKGFRASDNPTHLVENGTFFKNDMFPSIGYNRKYEITDNKDRAKHDLPPKVKKVARDHPFETKYGQTGGDGSRINFEMVLSTETDQVAVAPGDLLKEWEENNRRYFHYKMNKPMINFYSLVSGRYEVMREQWSPVTDPSANVSLEIMHHPTHTYNLTRMMNGMKKSLDYFTQNFSNYPYRHLRIMEYPRYTGYAQSFPGTIPYSESLGFILDINEEKDVDIPFYVTAHETAHQWWGLHLVAANVQGKHFILETLAQYSALMVLKKEYSEAKVNQFLEGEYNKYLKDRKSAPGQEVPLDLVTNESYIYYSKGAVNMYALHEYITEDSVNMALQRFIRDRNGFNGVNHQENFPTTYDLIDYFREVTPDSLQYLLTDLFETVTLYDNELVSSHYTEMAENSFEVTLNIKPHKYKIDSAGVESSVPSNDWIPVGIFTNNSTGEEELIYLEKHLISGDSVNLTVQVTEIPSKIVIDPHHRLIDRNKENDLSTPLKKEKN